MVGACLSAPDGRPVAKPHNIQGPAALTSLSLVSRQTDQQARAQQHYRTANTRSYPKQAGLVFVGVRLAADRCTPSAILAPGGFSPPFFILHSPFCLRPGVASG
jgi:hypothetical protein